MALKVSLVSIVLLAVLCSPLSLSSGEDVTVTIEGVTTIATTDDNFICATLDWWPPEKCNYEQCPWGHASILNLNLHNKILFNAVKAFNSMRIRLGGSLQDQVVYEVGKSAKDCPKFKTSEDGLFGFSHGCLPMGRWDELNNFFSETGSIVTFGLNALFGRHKITNDGLWGHSWDQTNARDFMNYTVSKGYKIDSWEFGNELSGGGVSARIDPNQYGEDLLNLKSTIEELYPNTQPKLLAPGGFFDAQWFAQFLQTSGPNVVNTITHHLYDLGPGDDPNLLDKIQDPYYLDNDVQTYRDVEVNLMKFAPWASAWVGESGGAYNSGGKDVSHTFVDSFWYLDQLGISSTFDHKVFCRQSLIGGNYGLLNTTSFVPNPDYYSALLWHRLMGPGVLSTTHGGSPYLRAYSHCSRQKPGVTLLLINLSNSTSFEVSVANDMNFYPPQSIQEEQRKLREEYRLTPKDGNIQSDVVLLNGSPVELTSREEIPALNPVVVEDSSPIYIAPQSIAFVNLKDFKAPACS